MDNLMSLAKLNSSTKPTRTPAAASPAINKPAPAPAPKKIDLCSFGRVQLLENLRSLAKLHNLPAVIAAVSAGEVRDANGKKKAKEKKPTYVDELVLVPYTRKRAAAAAAGEDPFRALVLHDELAGALVLRWKGVEIAARPRPRVRLVRGITPAIEAAHGELMRQEETCRGEDLGDIPDSLELEEKRRVLEARVEHFMTLAHLIMGDRKFDHPWKGTVVTSVVGTFLTQNVTDHMSSNAFMNLAAEFPLSKNGSNVEQSTNVPLLTDGCGLGESEPGDHGPANKQGKCRDRDKGIEEPIASIRAGEISNWDRERIRKVLHNRFEPSTARKIFHDIASIGDTSHWNSLLKEAYNNGYRKGDTDETVDWEALLHAPFAKIEECIRDRGNQSQMALRILAFLIRIKRDHGSIDLEWLRYVPRAKARKYLRSINGLGAKSVDCIRLLSLRHRAFPVDTNVARIVTRLGWVELQPLADSQEFHLVNTYPVMADIQKYLEPLLCNIPADDVYELHCQQITFGKSICTKRRPNCGACPFTGECKYFQSLISRAKGALPEYSQQGERRQTNMDRTPRHTLIMRPDLEQVHRYQIEMRRHCSEPIVEMPKTPPREDLGAQMEMEKGTERYCCEPIIEMPKTPPREDLGSQSDEQFEEEYDDEEEEEQEEDIEDIEDVGYDEMIDLRPMQQTENATTEPTDGKEIISIQPHVSSTPMIKRYRLRMEYTAYKIPDGHEILDRFDPRVPGDHIQYLLIIRSLLDEHSVTATILIPCRTANGGVFPLNGTYYQHNEVFVDHSSSRSPIKIKRKSIDIYNQCTVYFGASIHSVTRGQTQEGIYQFYHKGYICNREFDRSTRLAKDLSAQIHATNVKGTGRKRSMTSSSPG
ncbi:unnamed protein product [Urochloa humidicola]